MFNRKSSSHSKGHNSANNENLTKYHPGTKWVKAVHRLTPIQANTETQISSAALEGSVIQNITGALTSLEGTQSHPQLLKWFITFS